jgi:hypothetical protein
MKKSKESGSTLLLVLMAVVILSMIGISALDRTGTDLAITGNFAEDKTAFFTAESAVHYGNTELLKTMNPLSIQFEITEKNKTFKTGAISDSAPQTIRGYRSAYLPPPPVGVSIELGGDAGIKLTAWEMLVSSKVTLSKKHPAQKEINAGILIFSAEY